MKNTIYVIIAAVILTGCVSIRAANICPDITNNSIHHEKTKAIYPDMGEKTHIIYKLPTEGRTSISVSAVDWPEFYLKKDKVEKRGEYDVEWDGRLPDGMVATGSVMIMILQKRTADENECYSLVSTQNIMVSLYSEIEDPVSIVAEGEGWVIKWKTDRYARGRIEWWRDGKEHNIVVEEHMTESHETILGNLPHGGYSYRITTVSLFGIKGIKEGRFSIAAMGREDVQALSEAKETTRDNIVFPEDENNDNKITETQQISAKKEPLPKPIADKYRTFAESTGTKKHKYEIVIQSGHEEQVTSLSFSPDGDMLASASQDKTVKIWSLKTGELLRTIDANLNFEQSIEFSPDGKAIASGSDGEVRVWSASEGVLEMKLGSDLKTIRKITFSPDGKYIAAAYGFYAVEIWDAKTGNTVSKIKSQSLSDHQISDIAFSRDGQIIASTGSDNEVRLWSALDGEYIGALSGHNNWVLNVAFCDDGKRLASEDADGTIKLWSVPSGRLLRTYEGKEKYLKPASFRLDLKYFAIRGDKNTVELHSLETDKIKRSITNGDDFVTSIVFSKDGSLIAVGSKSGNIRIWADDGKTLLWTFGDMTSGRAIAMSPDGKLLAVQENCCFVVLWNAEKETTDKIGDNENRQVASAVAISPDGKMLAIGGFNLNDVDIWNVTYGKKWATIDGAYDRVQNLAFSPDGNVIAFSTRKKAINLWSVQNKELLYVADGGKGSSGRFAFSHDGKQMAIYGESDIIQILSVKTGEIERKINTGINDLYSVAFKPDGSELVALNKDSIGFYKWPSGEYLHSWYSADIVGFDKVFYSENGKNLIVRDKYWQYGIFQTADGVKIASLVFFPNANWLVYTDDGYFDCTEGAKKYFRLREGGKLYTADTYYGILFSHGLLTDLLAGKDIRKQ